MLVSLKPSRKEGRRAERERSFPQRGAPSGCTSSCSARLTFSHIQMLIAARIKPWFSVHSAQSHWWCRTGNPPRHEEPREMTFFFFGDRLKIAIKVLDTDLYLFISFPTSAHIHTLSVSAESLRILACRGKKKGKKIKIHQLMCRLVMK